MSDTLNCVNICASRSATSWIWLMLSLHPEVCVCKPKELNYFIDKFNLGPQWYAKHFDDHAKVTVDISPMCYYYKETCERIRSNHPEATLLCTLRNPYDRAVDQLYFYFRQRHGKVSGITLDELKSCQKGIEHCLMGSEYHKRLLPFFAAYPRESIKILFFDTLVEDTWAFLHQLYEAVGVAPDYHPPDDVVQKQVNSGDAEPRSRFLFKALRRGYLAANTFKPTALAMDFLERRFDLAFRLYRLLQRPTKAATVRHSFLEIFGEEGKQRLENELRLFNEDLGITTPRWNP